MECDAGSAGVEWRRWSRRHNGSAQVTDGGRLVLAPLSADDEGLYRCTASLIPDAWPSSPSLISEELLPDGGQEASGDWPVSQGPLIYLVVRGQYFHSFQFNFQVAGAEICI